MLAYGTKMPRVNWPTQLAQFNIPLPPPDDQERIAAFLDASCSALDKVVAAKRQQIETLDMLLQSIIHRTVTCGLNSDVDTASHGVENYEGTPLHWTVSKLRYEISIKNGDFISDKLQDDGAIQVFGGNGMMGRTNLFNVDGETVVVGRVGAYCGNAHYIKGKAWISDNALIVKSHHHALFLCHLFNTLNFNGQANNTAQPVITGTKIKNTYVVLPPKKEQELICDFIECKNRKIEILKKNLNSQVLTLLAYRKSLIHECMTGQLRVTEEDLNRVLSNG
jgi:type I restriction enzyme, S subunit